MATIKTHLGKNGRVVIPAQFRKTLGILEGDTLMMTLDDGMIRILTPQKAIQRVQEMVRRYVPEGVSLADELIAERRAEAARE
jgi:AbrB family looped-hinge helix DNA binding protein